MKGTLDYLFRPTKPDSRGDDEVVDQEECTDYNRMFESPQVFAQFLDPSWRAVLRDEFSKPYFMKLLGLLREETRNIFPPREDILNAFKFCPFDKVRVVIVGQDPYHEVGQAHGLAFSVRKGVTIPPSLRNIYKELKNEYGGDFTIPQHGYLESWARQGILLLNTALTVAESDANSHSKFGWLNFTKAVLDAVSNKTKNVVFIAWGKPAQKLCAKIPRNRHLVLESGHPSPLSVKLFLGNNHFKATNDYLLSHQLPPINWNTLMDD